MTPSRFFQVGWKPLITFNFHVRVPGSSRLSQVSEIVHFQVGVPCSPIPPQPGSPRKRAIRVTKNMQPRRCEALSPTALAGMLTSYCHSGGGRWSLDQPNPGEIRVMFRKALICRTIYALGRGVEPVRTCRAPLAATRAAGAGGAVGIEPLILGASHMPHPGKNSVVRLTD